MGRLKLMLMGDIASMIRLSFILQFFIFSLLLVGCKPNNVEKDFIDSITGKLTDSSGIISITIPDDLNGYLVISSPYAISNIESLNQLELNKNVSEQLIGLIQDDSAYHLFIISKDAIVAHKKWTSPPVVFNNFFYVRLTGHKAVVFTVTDKVLKKVTEK